MFRKLGPRFLDVCTINMLYLMPPAFTAQTYKRSTSFVPRQLSFLWSSTDLTFAWTADAVRETALLLWPSVVLFCSLSNDWTSSVAASSAVDLLASAQLQQQTIPAVHFGSQLYSTFYLIFSSMQWWMIQPSSRQHFSNDDCLEDRSKVYQNCFVLYCTIICKMKRTHRYPVLQLAIG